MSQSSGVPLRSIANKLFALRVKEGERGSRRQSHVLLCLLCAQEKTAERSGEKTRRAEKRAIVQRECVERSGATQSSGRNVRYRTNVTSERLWANRSGEATLARHREGIPSADEQSVALFSARWLRLKVDDYVEDQAQHKHLSSHRKQGTRTGTTN